ncbi:glycoside hydrolase domain-containing protein [Robertmurraya kyonggiensis]|uniref:DUF1906 domain-containing protein n=1 Tax=Robertmurraya kyonggiensis TaxID=1037680 RepID=A0A4U1DAG9_9BACI|nr:glycoside hydrolase domain-containing protein [Robertmurraya kyonggiensis]TKC19531.1 DUF1906 domain-containing protein [Robertmurraya kyonggiensis]
MEKGKLIPLFVTAFFVVVVTIFSFSLVKSNPSEPVTGKVSADGSETTENVESGDGTVTNNVENNINGENAEVTNTINNSVKNGKNNTVDNNVSNNIEVNVNVNVTNDIGNNIEGQNANASQENTKETSNNGQEEKPADQNGETGAKENDPSNDDEVVWGVDSASSTDSEMLSCVRENYGEPKVWGRYLGEKEGVSSGITTDEAEFLHSNNILVLPIWNHFTDATGYDSGKSEAEQAIKKAEELGLPAGVPIFADIEPSYPVNSEFIKAWYDVLGNSNYKPGIYGVFESGNELTTAFEEAAGNDKNILASTYIWTASPHTGTTSESNAPTYEPEAPENSLVGGWQYGIEGKACNIDTNLFSGKITEILW